MDERGFGEFISCFRELFFSETLSAPATMKTVCLIRKFTKTALGSDLDTGSLVLKVPESSAAQQRFREHDMYRSNIYFGLREYMGV